MSLEKEINQFIKQYELQSKKIIVAVSGGIDSMTLLFCVKHLNPIVAHCNFNLRGSESDGDEKFVKQYCSENNLEFHSTSFNTKGFATENKISTQMAARDLRYNWFEKLRKETNSDYIAVGTTLNDNLETFLINFGRGSGIKGLSGISESSNYIIRPFLAVSRTEILNFVEKKNIKHREDSSNKSTDYVRNAIRHKVIPELSKIFPEFQQTTTKTILNLNQANNYLSKKLEEDFRSFSSQTNEQTIINISKLLKHPNSEYILYEFLKRFDFNSDQTQQILDSAQSQSGKIFHSKTHQILKDRSCFIITSLEEKNENHIQIKESTKKITTPLPIKFSIQDIDSIKFSKKRECFNFDKLTFPLTVRKWQKGDIFQPLGMKGKKKISDFLIDKKINLIEKENTYVLESNNEIVWLIGHRISEKFKVTTSTKKVYLSELYEL